MTWNYSAPLAASFLPDGFLEFATLPTTRVPTPCQSYPEAPRFTEMLSPISHQAGRLNEIMFAYSESCIGLCTASEFHAVLLGSWCNQFCQLDQKSQILVKNLG